MSALGTLTLLTNCTYIPLPDLHTRFLGQQFHRWFKHHTLLCTLLLQPGVDTLYLGSPRVGRSGYTIFGFCNRFFPSRSGFSNPQSNPQLGGPGAPLCQAPLLFDQSGMLKLPETEVLAGTARWVLETRKLHYLDKVVSPK